MFKNTLKSEKGGDSLQVQIACPMADEKTCSYAEQFINLFGGAGWQIQPSISRVTLTRAREGITVFRRGGTQQNALSRWDSGGYFQISEPHLLAVQEAFQGINIEIEGGTNPDLTENVMAIYFGPEKDDESKPTPLTVTTEWIKGDRQGPFPTQQP